MKSKEKYQRKNHESSMGLLRETKWARAKSTQMRQQMSLHVKKTTMLEHKLGKQSTAQCVDNLSIGWN